MFKKTKKPAILMARAGLAAAAVALWTVAMSAVSLAQTATVPEEANISDLAASPIPSASASISRVTSGAEMLHVVVGRSLFLNTRSRLRRVYVADPNILNSVTLSPNQIVVTAMASGISSLILLDEAGQTQSYVVSSDLDVAGLRTAMYQAMHGDIVNVEGNGDRVTLSGKVSSDAQADTAVKLAGLYTKDVENVLTVASVHPKQVRLKVRILEVDRSKAKQYGINLFNPGGNTSFLAATTTSEYNSTATYSPNGTASGMLTTTNPLNFLLYSTKLNLGATVQDLESKQVLQILAEPTITTISGEKADFLSGGEFPFPMIQPGGNGGAPVVTISFREYGVKLEFTPIVNADGTIRLKVAPEVSSLDYTNSATIGGFTVPALATRRAQTEVELRSDQSFAISGLLDQRTTDIMSKTPGAADIPILGALFKSKNASHSNTELVVIVTPTLVDPLTETAEPSQPDMPISPLNSKSFDKSLGDNHNPQPADPPINPPPPPASNPVPAASPSPAPVTAPVAEVAKDVTLAQAGQSTAASPAANPAKVAAAPTASTIAASGPASSAPGVGPSRSPSLPGGAGPMVSSNVAAPAVASAQSPRRYVFDNPTPSSADTSGKPAAEADPGTRSMVQIMALSNKEDAESMAVALKRHGYNVAVSHDPVDSLLHLEVGPFASKTDAEAMRQRLLHDGYNATVK